MDPRARRAGRAGASGQVFVVGDDDQAIYGWRGARVENVQHFLRDFPGATTIRLEQNYRSTGTILKAANAIIANNPQRLGKELWTAGEPGAPIALYAAYNEQDEARFAIERIREHIQQGGRADDCAILYRSNAQSRNFEEQLIQHDIRYRVYGGLRFFDRAEIKDTLAYLRLVANRHDDAAFERTVNTPPRGIGERTLDALRQRARAERCSLWDAALHELTAAGLAGRAKNALKGFLVLIGDLGRTCAGIEDDVAEGEAQNRDLLEAGAPPLRDPAAPRSGSIALAEQIDHAIQRSGLRDYYEADSRGSAESRVENLDELVNVASRFERTPEDVEAGFSELVAFLSHAALEAGDTQGEAWEDCVQLMTLHSAKGLEFPAGAARRPRRRPLSEPALARGSGPARRGTPPRLCRHHARARDADPHLRRIAAAARRGDLQSSLALPARTATRTAARSAAARSGFATALQSASAMQARTAPSSSGSASASVTRASAKASSSTRKGRAVTRACR